VRGVTLLECTCQSEETLEQHFEELNRQHVNGQGTLKLIERLREFPDDRTVFALTSVEFPQPVTFWVESIFKTRLALVSPVVSTPEVSSPTTT